MVKESRAYQYALWCVEENNKKVGKYVKKQAQSWIDIVNGKDEEALLLKKHSRK